MKAKDYMPSLYEGNKILPSDILDDRLPPIGNVYYAKKTADADYSYFFNKYNYVNDRGQNSVQNTITAAMALLQNYDTLIICPGNWDEALKITLTGKHGVKILGYNTGMQWGEGSTCWRNVESTDDIFAVSGCNAIEIAGIGFVNVTSGKNILELAGNCYSAHIHHCCFIGSSGTGGNPAARGVSHEAGDNPDTYIHDCLFMHCTRGVYSNGTRCRVINNRFIGVTSGAAIEHIPGAGSRPNCIYAGNEIIGHGTTDYGILLTGSPTAGKIGIFGNYICNCNTPITKTNLLYGCGNLESNTNEPEYTDLGD